MWDGLDHRRFPRLGFECDIDIQESKSTRHISTITQNIGVGGLCVLLNKEIPKFSEVSLRLHLDDGAAPIECQGRICWMVRSSVLFKEEDQFDAGIEFVDLPEESLKRVKEIILNVAENA